MYHFVNLYKRTSKLAFCMIVFCVGMLSAKGAIIKKDARAGVLDLRTYDFDTMPIVSLGGDWFFLENSFTRSIDSVIKYGKSITILKENWQDIGYNCYGFGTYAITIKINEKYKKHYQQSVLGLKVCNIFDAYKLYLNGELVAQKGIIAKEKANYTSQMGYETVFFTPASDSLTIVVQVTNYINPSYSGIGEKMLLSTQSQIFRSGMFNNYLFVICFGIMILFAMYHFMFYWLRRGEKENLYFAIICLLFSIKCLTEGDKMIFYFLPHLSSVIYYKLWFLSVDIIYFLALFYYLLFPNEIKKTIVTITLIVFSFFSVLIVILPTSYGFITSKIVYLYSIPLILYVAINMAVAVIRKRSYAWPNLLGIIAPTIFGINDLLYALNIIETGYYSAFGFVFYIITQSAILSYKAAKAFRDVELLTQQLADANHNLESLVEERTRALNEANKQLLHTNATKDRFFTILAHDLRSPISTIRSLLELIVIRHESYTKEKITQMVNILSESSRSTYDLLDNLLNWAKAQRKEIHFVRSFCNLHELVQDNILLFLPAVQQKNISLKNEVNEGLSINCDRNIMNTVIRNLLNNAIKFTPKDGVIRVKSNKTTDGIKIQIIDSGVGMNEDTAKALFNNDVVLQSSRGTAGEKGSGLGLVLCRDFIALHDGTISVESTLGAGSCFTIFLPDNK